MKLNRTVKYCGLGLAALLMGSVSSTFAQTADLVFSTFDTGTIGSQPSGCGIEWGTGNGSWDGTQDNSGNSGGSLLATTVFSTSSDTCFNEYICPNGGNWYYEPTPISFSLYKSLDFDIKWDNTSDMTIAQYNDPGTFPASLLQSWAPAGYLSGSTPGLDVITVGPSGNYATLATIPVPAAAASGWTHVSIPINASEANIDGRSGIVFHKWINQNWGVASSNPTARMWIDNVTLIGTAGPPPPPTINSLTKPVPGLNVFNSTQGNSFYDRQEVELVNKTGLSWVGQTGSGPVSYSFTISSFPSGGAYSGEAYLFLVPNPGNLEGAPDYNETNCAIFEVQSTSTGGFGSFIYKTNLPSSETYITATNVQSSTILGTWTVQFTSDVNGTLIAPDGTTSSFTLPSDVAALFAAPANFNIYLGGQANSAAYMNHAVVYSNFAISGLGASSMNENFAAETTLNTSVWNNAYASGPNGVLIVPAGSAYWIQWTLPDTGFSLEQTAALPGSWMPVTTGAAFTGAGVRMHLLSSASLPPGNSAFFHLIKRAFSQLQVLLPGETAAPGTPTGKTGTPTPVSLGSGGFITFTVNAVDANWFPVGGITDTVTISTSDGSAITPLNAALVNGTAQFSLEFQTEGSWTITATDVTDGTKTANTSSSVTVGP